MSFIITAIDAVGFKQTVGGDNFSPSVQGPGQSPFVVCLSAVPFININSVHRLQITTMGHIHFLYNLSQKECTQFL